MARVTNRATRNTLKLKRPGNHQSRPKPIPNVAVHDEKPGESTAKETHARVRKGKRHLKKYKKRATSDPNQRRFETPILHFNPETQDFGFREDTPAENMADIDDRDFTSSHRDQDSWSLDNLPDILYVLRPKPENAKSRRVVHMTDHMIFEKKIRNFYALPPRISSQVEGFRLEAWFRLDRRIKPEDILDRVNPRFRHYISEQAIQDRRAAFRLGYNVADWTSQKSINAITRLVKKAGVDVELNTTRGLTPGLIDPAKGEAGGRVGLSPVVYQQQPAPQSQVDYSWWIALRRFQAVYSQKCLPPDDPYRALMQQHHGAEQGVETPDAQMMHLSHSNMNAPVSNQDNRINQLNQFNYYAAPGSAAPAMEGTYVAPGQQQYYPQFAQANHPMPENNPIQTAPAQRDATIDPTVAGQFPAPRAAVPTINPRMRHITVRSNGSPVPSSVALPPPAQANPASARMARSGRPAAMYPAQMNQHSVPMNGYQQGASSAQMSYANPVATLCPETASNSLRAPQFSDMYPFYSTSGNPIVSGRLPAYAGLDTYSDAMCHVGQKRAAETDTMGGPTLSDKRRRFDLPGIVYPAAISEVAAHPGPVPEEYAETGDEDSVEEVHFEDFLVESAMTDDEHIRWRSDIEAEEGVDKNKTEEEKQEEKKQEEKKQEEKKQEEKKQEEKKQEEKKQEEKKQEEKEEEKEGEKEDEEKEEEKQDN